MLCGSYGVTDTPSNAAGILITLPTEGYISCVKIFVTSDSNFFFRVNNNRGSIDTTKWLNWTQL